MCYTCGCGVPRDNHGDDANITDDSFQKAADASELEDANQAKRNTLKMLLQEFPEEKLTE